MLFRFNYYGIYIKSLESLLELGFDAICRAKSVLQSKNLALDLAEFGSAFVLHNYRVGNFLKGYV